MIQPIKQQRILITGARGFIGSTILRRLTERGYTVSALTSDIRMPLPSADIIIHCAGRKNDEQDSYDVNVGGAQNLLKSGARIINVSTVATYLPKQGLYGRTKAEADGILKDHTTLKLGLVYGNGGILATLIRWTALPVVPVYGNAQFHPIYVEDVAEIIEQSLAWAPGVYNIGGQDAVTLAEMVREVARIVREKRVWTLPLPRFVARLYLTESNMLGAEQTVAFTERYGRPFLEGLKDICNRTSQ